MTATFYRNVLHQLLQRMRRVQLEFLNNDNWSLLHDSAIVHKINIIQDCKDCNNFLSSLAFFLFPKIKTQNKEGRYELIIAKEAAMTRQ